MKKFVYLLALATALVATPAMAADIDAPPPPTDDLRPASYDWSGLYVGAALSATCIDGVITDNATAPATMGYPKGCGPRIAGIVGANFQSDHMVFGLETDISMSDEIAKNLPYKLSFKHAGSVRARVGYAMDNILLYGTGGYAYGSSRFDIVPNIGATIKQSELHHGWTVGAGMEYAISDVWRLRGEYRLTQLGASNNYESCGGCVVKVDYGNIHEFSVGAVYAFDWH